MGEQEPGGKPDLPKVDRLSEATNGRLRMTDPGMDERSAGWELFPKGVRVEVNVKGRGWIKGTVVETILDNDRGMVVHTDERILEPNMDRGGHGLYVDVIDSTRGRLWSVLRLIDEPRQEV